MLVDLDIDIFDEHDVINHVKNKNYVEEVFDDEQIIEYVKDNFVPENVFTLEALKDWARMYYEH